MMLEEQKEKQRAYKRKWNRAHPLTEEQKVRKNDMDRARPITEEQRKRKLATSRQWAADNPGRVLAWREAHRERAQELIRRWVKNNPERVLANRNKWAKHHPAQMRSARLKWVENNHELDRASKNAWYQRNKKDLNFLIRCRLRSRLWRALRETGAAKSASAIKLIGISIAELRLHLESLFVPGMSWAHILSGEIHLDHKRPCASFDLTDPAQQRQCFHYTNLQPLWAVDNLRKGDRYAGSLD